MNSKPVLNKNSPWSYMELEFDLFSIAKKLVKYVVHSSKRKKEKRKFSSDKVPK
jgi:hypothetical protein